MAANGGEREAGGSAWDWFWWGVLAGAAYALWRNPGGVGCCLVLLGVLALVVAIVIAVVLWAYWQVLLLLVCAFFLYRRFLLPWLRERHERP